MIYEVYLNAKILSQILPLNFKACIRQTVTSFIVGFYNFLYLVKSLKILIQYFT